MCVCMNSYDLTTREIRHFNKLKTYANILMNKRDDSCREKVIGLKKLLWNFGTRTSLTSEDQLKKSQETSTTKDTYIKQA